MMLHYARTDPFSGVVYLIGVLDFGSRKNHPPALLHDSGSEMYYVLDYMWIIITLLLYSVIAYGCVAL